jgi:hypothetical protein
LALLRVRLVLRLAAGDERGQPFDALVIPRHVLLPRLEVLQLRLRLMLLRRVLLRLILVMLVVLIVMVLLRLVVLLLARVVRLRLRRVGLAHLGLIVAIVEAIVGKIAAHAAAGLLLLEIRLALAKLLLRGSDQTKIMLGVLIVILGGDRIPGALRVTG